jgi:fructokinase
MDAALNHDDSYIFASPTAGDGVVAGTGLTALDRIYAQGHSRPLEALGGSCGNVLMSLAMLGHPVAPVIALGDDAHGDYLVDQFRRAGCETRFVFRKSDRSSPVIVEHVDPHRAHHWFSFTCPETFAALPRWRPIDEEEVRSARGTLEHASVFYVDRLSPAIVTAMEAARNAGAVVFFEPAAPGEERLFARALQTASILKLSDETVDAEIANLEGAASTVVMRTHGARGLTASFAGTERFFSAQPAPRLIDTCGSGDMVTTGMLDHLLRRWPGRVDWTAQDVFASIETGQRLAALNCAFAGARGVFHALGGQCLRSGLDSGLKDTFVAHAMTFGPYDGY